MPHFHSLSVTCFCLVLKSGHPYPTYLAADTSGTRGRVADVCGNAVATSQDRDAKAGETARVPAATTAASFSRFI